MYSLILQIAARHLLPILVVYSILILLRGHNAPGGGFIGGLLAAAGYILYAIAYGVEDARKKLKLDPRTFIGIGLFCALISGLPSFIKDQPFTTVEFGILKIPLIGKLSISTPLIFDIGVFFVVIGVLLTIVFTLSEE
jgi:multicomponent Na+:H+ antiporter subunit B